MTASPSRSSRSARAVIVAAVLGGALLGALLSLAFGEPARRTLFDAWQRAAPRPIDGDRVAVVLIDPESIDAVGPWPWPRYYLARLIEEIARQRPRAIGFDIIFPEADRLNPDSFAALYPELDPSAHAALSALPTMDAAFASVLGQAPVVLARLGIEADGSDPAELMVAPEVRGRPPPDTLSYRQVLASIHEIDDVALAHGMINGPPDDDGIVRRVPLTVIAGGRPLPGLAVELARLARGLPELSWRGGQMAFGDRLLPADATAGLWLRFGEFPFRATFGGARVLAGHVPPDAFRGKVVLIGLGSEGTADLVSTPLATEGYGVFVQAQAVDAILTGGWLKRPPWIPFAEWATGALLAVLVLSAGLAGRRWPLAVAFGTVALLALAATLAFDRANLLFDPLRPLLLVTGAGVGLAVVLFARARTERARLAAELVDQRVASALQEGELQAARRIQLGMVPSARALATLDPRVEVAGMLKSARQVGGDFYEAVRLDADRLLFVIGDVTGKGVPAALYMALSKTLTKSVLIRHRGSLGETVASLNLELLREADEDMGVTMLIALLDCASGDLAMVNAGHENPIVVRADGTAASLPLQGGPPFCVCDFPYPEERARLTPGETLVLITDGVTEAQDDSGALFGLGRTLDALGQAPGASARARIDRLRDAVASFEGDKEASDDLTIVAIRFLGVPAA